MTDADFSLAIHGGCGVLPRATFPAAFAADVRAALAASLDAGATILRAGGSALDAVEAAVVVMEDAAVFNAGHGAAFNAAGGHELDAAIMDGRTLEAGAIAGARAMRNPIRVCRAIMASGDFLLLLGDGADDFARQKGFAIVPQDYYGTEQRRQMLAEMKALAAQGATARANEAQKHGTVGAVARDGNGHLAAATSTGGFNNKQEGRVGDSPIIGAGTYARDGVCAVSCTGQGEFFIRRVAAYDVAARMQYGGQTLDDATHAVVFDALSSHQIGAGMITLGAQGNPLARYNTLGMFRGWIATEGQLVVATHKELHPMGPA